MPEAADRATQAHARKHLFGVRGRRRVARVVYANGLVVRTSFTWCPHPAGYLLKSKPAPLKIRVSIPLQIVLGCFAGPCRYYLAVNGTLVRIMDRVKRLAAHLLPGSMSTKVRGPLAAPRAQLDAA